MTAEADSGVRRRALGRLLLRVAALIATFVALVAFSVVLAKVTLTPSPASEDLVASNLRPGRSLRQYAQDYTFLAACKQAGGNLLLGAPFGVLLPILVPRRLRMLRMTLLTVLVMALVELAQGALVVGRAFDIDDVILNTAGALLGYAFVGRRISHRYHTLSAEEPPKERAAAAKKPRPRRTKPRGTTGAGSAARRSASAPTARGRALRDRWRSRREGPGGEAPGARRRGA
ncbi:VanZ family protein [Streptomyces sp. NPDC048565]|uniref:VanZ family protein n=1 Tax=Streptomyces sp. NPDC048565 TaxID=3155266 RepID=UPI0034286F47